MDWAHKREWTVIAVLTAFVIAVLAIISFAVFYHTPTCTDNKQDGNETGVDCGGSCSTVCSAQAEQASVRFARVLTQSGRNDLIAYVDNPNTDAYAARADLILDLFTQDGHELTKHVYVPLLADSATPVFVPGVVNSPVQQAFLTFASGSPMWTKGTGGTESMPKASDVNVGGTTDAPRITATVTNPTAYPEHSVPFIASVFAADGTIIAASQTVVPLIPSQGSAQAVFTWNEAFSAPYARIEVVPVLALPTLIP